MKRLSQILSYASALLSGLTLVRLKGRWATMERGAPKLLAGAWAPFLALAGGLGR
jgi:hypothetical protein